ncbi:MAG: hypothetical protein H8E79_06690 [Desulfobulbaceae bacterium]|uniref:Nucleoside transporter/FeoB GTPase Gate domain-containing protein n=1 Tax=Candidatus Desulfatifera sulfidica TaxID=2841691 RepID=A0A8J6TAH3_9BACT|nr:hypothetical protein [Candidatus Desulfatifera sulfidica]
MSTVFPGFAGVVVQWFRSLLLETFHTSWTLIRITLPIIFIVKILTELGLINIITRLLDPLMSLVGLPGSMGLVWATALFTNIYAGMIVFAGLAASLEITAAQATIISSMMLFAHSLPVELAITRKAGVGIGFIAFLRMAAAMIYGMILYHACEFFGLWQQDAVVMFRPLPEESGWLPWLIGQGENLRFIRKKVERL